MRKTVLLLISIALVAVSAGGMIVLSPCPGLAQAPPPPPPPPAGIGDGNLLKRSQEETCHACHLTDQNTWSTNVNAIRSHSSTNTGSTKWSTTGWGITGGKYGQFVCTTCHTAHNTQNIYLVKELIKTPDSTNWPGGSAWVTVDFRMKSGGIGTIGLMGNDTDAPRTSSKRICEVCHSLTNYHKYNQLTTTGHEDGNDCTGCHTHKAAFGGGGACNGCHGAPPGSGTDTNNAAQYAASHAQHYDGAAGGLPPSYTDAANRSTASVYVFGCGKCHSTVSTDHGTSENDGIVNVMLNAGTGGTFTRGLSTMANPLPPGSKTFYDFDSKCSNVYCHGNFVGGAAGNVPVWGSSSTGACGTCHGFSTTAWPTGGSHYAHVGTIIGLKLSCDKCHHDTALGFGTLNNRTYHVNERADWNLDSADSRFNGASYEGVLAGTAGWSTTGGPYGQCTNLYCHSSVQANWGTLTGVIYASPTWGSAVTGACGTCHNTDSTTSGKWLTTGSHKKHIIDNSYPCSYCHSGAGDGTSLHADRNIDVVPSPTYGGSYSQGGAGNNPPGNGYGYCSSVYCHGTLSPAWGSSVSFGCSGCHPTTAWNTSAHRTHVGTIAVDYAFDCTLCHDATVYFGYSTIKDKTLHLNGVKNINFGSWNPQGTVINNTCQQLYCHSQGTGWTSNIGDTRPLNWRTVAVSGWYTSFDCGMCHGTDSTGRPTYTSWNPKANSHVAHGSYTCDACHFATTSDGTTITSVGRHVNRLYDMQWKTSVGNYGTFSYTYSVDGGTCTNIQCHGGSSAVWGSSGSANLDCITCHTGPKGPRRAIVGEFSLTWSHKRSDNRTVAKFDCGVCHMEGNAQTGYSDATYHRDGKIDLRDPDTGDRIMGAQWVSNGGVAGNGWYTSTGQYATILSFKRNLGSSQLEPEVAAIQINHCLKCHDNNGAQSSLAWVSGGNASRPFDTWVTGSPWYTGYYVANGLRGGVVDIKRQFWTSNAAYHPIYGKSNNTYTWGTTMVPPWNGITKSMGTLSGGANVQPWGNLMSCWDCHAAKGQTGWVTATVTAHGAPDTLRGPIWNSISGTTSTTSFCLICHNENTYGTPAVTLGHHGTGSAFSSGADTAMSNTTFQQCSYCHAAAPSGGQWNSLNMRPIRGENVHGADDRTPGVPGSWNSFRVKPYAFIRNTLTGWSPGWNTNIGTCQGASGATCDNNMSPGNYSPGGAY